MKSTKTLATQAGVSNETGAEWLNLAIRYSRRGNSIKAADCAAEALHIHNTYGIHDSAYAFSDLTLDRVNALVIGYTIAINWN